MTTTDPGARDQPRPTGPPPSRGAPPEPTDDEPLGGGVVRAVVVLVLCVVVGVGLLVVGYDEDAANDAGFDFSALGGDDEDDADAPAAEGGGEGDAAASTARPIAEVPVYVANGTGVGGRAQAVTDQLRAAGYTAAIDPGDAPQVQNSQVFYLPDWQADAEAVAAALALGPERVAPWPDPAPFPPPFGGTVIVQLGTDLAG